MIPDELQRVILSYIEPWLTRDNWRTCKEDESRVIRQTVETLEGSCPRNNFVPIPYKTWSFYDRLRFGKEHYLESPYLWRSHAKHLTRIW
jgi:hypothetical protein